MLDEAAGRCQMGDQSNPRFMFTAKLEVRYRKNVPVGQPIRIVGQAGPRRNRSAQSYAAIYDELNNLLAEANAVLVDLPKDAVDPVDLGALGWRVYSDEEIGIGANP
jgi:acyl-CoA thioesterase FadM